MQIPFLGGVPFLGGAYEGRSSNVSPETCINLFYESGVSGEALIGTAGSAVLVTPAVGEVRGGIAYNDLAYFVVGNTFYEIDSAGNSTSRGTLNTSAGRVSMAHNGVRPSANQQIMVVDGTDGWIFDNAATTFTQITDTDFVSADQVVFIDGYFLFNQAGKSDRFWFTNQYDGTAVEATDFATAEGWPDEIVSIVADNREIFIFGAETLEIWYNSGDTDTTFQRYQGGFKQHGCVAPWTPQRFDNSVVWLSRNDRGDGLIVTLGEGYQPTVISSPELNYQISTYKNLDQAFAYSYQHEGHEFYVITFPGNDATWAYDAATKQWHRRAHEISGHFPSRERYNCHVFAFGEHLFGDYLDGSIYKLDGSLGTFAGGRVERERTTPTVTDEENRRRLSTLQLDMEEGIGDGNTANDDEFWLSYSKNGGHTYGNEVARSAGEGGEWARRVIWRRLGHARNWIFRIRTWTTKRPVLKGLIARMHGEGR
jgi:hypothetical protein